MHRALLIIAIVLITGCHSAPVTLTTDTAPPADTAPATRIQPADTVEPTSTEVPSQTIDESANISKETSPPTSSADIAKEVEETAAHTDTPSAETMTVTGDATLADDTTTPPSQPATKPHNQHPLEAFQGTYRVYISKIPMPITADITLEPTSDTDTWKMIFNVDSLGIHNREESVFTWNNCRPKSQHYLHDLKGFGKKQRHETTFSWDPPYAINISDGEETGFSIPGDAVDDLTVLLQAACFLGDGEEFYDVTSVYGEKIRHNHFKLIDKETIDTPLGKLDTLVIEKLRKKTSRRRTLFWIAPKLNFMMVKAKHIENSALSGEVIMKSYQGPHSR